VQQVEHVSVGVDGFNLRQASAGAFDIDVAADGGDRRDAFERGKDLDFADVAEMKDAVDSSECRKGFGTEQAVGVGYNANSSQHGLQAHDEAGAGIETVAQSVRDEVE
jgi:hypothetical protein